MSDANANSPQRTSFAEAVRNFAGVPPKKFAKLLPNREGIAELRQKGASFGMIRELLAMAGIEVAADSVRRFYREVIEEPTTSAKRPPKRQRTATSAPPLLGVLPPSSSLAVASPAPTPPDESPRSRGPRIADPRNL